MIRAELERRPLFLIFAGLALGLTLPRNPLNLIFLVPIAVLITDQRPRIIFGAAFIVGAVLGPGQPLPFLQGREYVEGDWKVVGLPRVTAQGEHCDIERDGVRLSLFFHQDLDPAPGSIVHVNGVAEPPQEGTDTFFASRGLIGRMSADSISVVRDGPWIQRLGSSWRREFLTFAAKTLPPRGAAEISALCFNASGLLDESTKDELQRTGTIHLIAVSGLQVIILAQILLACLRWLPVPRWALIAIVGFILLLYAVATGLHPAVIRCSVMWIVANSAFLVRREPDWLSALSFSSVLILLWQPATVYEAGFLFSNLAVIFLSLFGRHSKWRAGAEALAIREAKGAVRTALVALLVVAPLTAYFFGFVSLVSAPANLLILVGIAPAVIIAMAALPLSYLVPAVAAGAMQATVPLLSFMEKVLSAYGTDRVTVTVPEFSGYWLVLYFVLLAMLWRPMVRQP